MRVCEEQLCAIRLVRRLDMKAARLLQLRGLLQLRAQSRGASPQGC